MTVINGSGEDRFTANVLVEDGRIARVADTSSGADRELQMSETCLATGFVDMHAHSELRLFDHPDATEKLTQGFTLEACGQDGVSVAPVPDDCKAPWARRVKALLGKKAT